jgi:hypothetical protein
MVNESLYWSGLAPWGYWSYASFLRLPSFGAFFHLFLSASRHPDPVVFRGSVL